MQLSEAYERLEWDTPLTFERAGMRGAAARGHGLRHLGTSAHMLIELYLDMERAARVIGVRAPGTEFVVVCKDVAAGRYLRRWLETVHTTLNLDVDPRRVRFLPIDANMDRLRGLRWYSWAVFCDHAVKDDDQDRNVGPYRLVRTLERHGDWWAALDRDGKRVCKLTDQGKRELADAATCPLTIREGTRIPKATYPAYQGLDDLNRCMLLRESFKR